MGRPWDIVGRHMLQDVEPRTPALCGSSVPLSRGTENASTKSSDAHRTYNLQLLHNRKLLEFLADDDSGQLTGPVIFDAPDHSHGTVSVRVENGNTSFVHISQYLEFLADSVIFDTRNCTFYEFPKLPGISDPKVRWCYALQGKPTLYSQGATSSVSKRSCSPSHTSLWFAPIDLSSRSSWYRCTCFQIMGNANFASHTRQSSGVEIPYRGLSSGIQSSIPSPGHPI